MTRVVALVVAVVVVVVAILIRDRIDDEGNRDGSARLVGATELEAVRLELDERRVYRRCQWRS